jgi:uncharacterized membrane protein
MEDRALRLTPGRLALGIVLLAAALRLYRLGARSLWLDEIITIYPVRFATLDELSAHLQPWWDNMPLPSVLPWLLRGLGGSEWAVRLPFAVAGTLAVGGLYGLGRDLGGPRIGLSAALLGALAPFLIWYSQEARPYAFLLLFTVYGMWAAYRATTTGQLAAWAALPVCLVLNLYTGYLALPVVAATGAFVGLSLLADLVAFLRRPRPRSAADTRRLVRQYAAAVGVALAIGVAYLLPWWAHLRFFLENNEVATIGLAAPHTATAAEALGLLTSLAALSPGLVYQLLALAILGLGWVCAQIRRGQGRPALLLRCWLLLPLAALWTQLQ